MLHASYEVMCRAVAARIAEVVRAKPHAVLGLATGSTPIGVYRELARLHRNEGLSFRQVRTFNLDEYFPIQPEAPQSYVRFMREQLFDHINIEAHNCHIPDGRSRRTEEVLAACEEYEERIRAAGGIDFQLLGVGRNGHIGFNEPLSSHESRTRLVTLDGTTRRDAAPDFFGIENVPARAVTMGIATILEAGEIALLASGASKAPAMREALEGPITSKVPASFLRGHSNAAFHLDHAAARELSSQLHHAPDSEPSSNTRRVLISAALHSHKTLRELSAHDVSEIKLPDESLQQTMREVEDDFRVRCDDDKYLPQGQKVLCLSPHPDDDVIACAATLAKMAARGNLVTVAYGVSGANAVRDKDVLALLRARHPRLISYLEESLAPGRSVEDAIFEVRESLFEREPGAPDAPLLRELKRLVREGEASDACRKIGARPRFLDLPFYNRGREGVGEDDVARMLHVLSEARPNLVLLTGEHNDPHGTHEQCAQAFAQAATKYLHEGGEPFQTWFYRGAWDDFATHEGDYFSLFGRKEMEAKIDAILDHISQLDPLFPGGQPKEFWERARDRNRSNARALQVLGVLPPSRSFDALYAEVFRVQPVETATAHVDDEG